MNSPELSVVVPMYRESANAAVALRQIQAHIEQACDRYELIVVDDGSPDDTWAVLCAEAGRNPSLRAIRLSRNFGKEHALCAGLEAARGQAVIVMDGDLQHPPALIPKLLAAWRQGQGQVIEAVKTNRGHETVLYSLFAAGFYRLLKGLSGFDLQGASDFKLLDRKVVEAWQRLGERSLFFRGMSAWVGFERVEVPFEVPSRLGGERSRWTFLGLVKLALTAVTAFSSVLLQLVTFFGLVFLAFAVLLGVYTVLVWGSGRAVTGFTTVILLLLIVGSLLMISLGIIGLYLARIYDEVKARPRYIVAETKGFTASRSKPVVEEMVVGS